MAEPTLYLFDGYNLLHAGAFEGARELVDRLASFVALRGADAVEDDDAARPAHGDEAREPVDELADVCERPRVEDVVSIE